MKPYLNLLSNCSNPETLEATAGSIHNLWHLNWQPSIDLQTAVRKGKGLPIIFPDCRPNVYTGLPIICQQVLNGTGCSFKRFWIWTVGQEIQVRLHHLKKSNRKISVLSTSPCNICLFTANHFLEYLCIRPTMHKQLQHVYISKGTTKFFPRKLSLNWFSYLDVQIQKRLELPLAQLITCWHVMDNPV